MADFKEGDVVAYKHLSGVYYGVVQRYPKISQLLVKFFVRPGFVYENYERNGGWFCNPESLRLATDGGPDACVQDK